MLIQRGVFHTQAGNVESLDCPLTRKNPSETDEEPTFFDNALLRGELKADWQGIEYPDLDFFICFEEGKKMFLRKYLAEPGVERFLNNPDKPVIKNVFTLVRSLWETSCKAKADGQL
jgi:hypothetical protein